MNKNIFSKATEILCFCIEREVEGEKERIEVERG